MADSDPQYVLRAEDIMAHAAAASGLGPRLGPWSLELKPRELVVLLGPRGCGKSTFLRALAGLLPLAGGRLQCEESTPGVVFGKPTLLPWRTLIENVMLGVEFTRAPTAADRDRARLLLGLLGAVQHEAQYEPALPGGIAQRAAVCRALVHKPALLLMDDPVHGLDPLTREQLWLELQRLWSEEGFAAVLATTDIAEAVHLADRVVVMGEIPGKIVRTVPIEIARPRRMSKAMTPLVTEHCNSLRTILRAQGALP